MEAREEAYKKSFNVTPQTRPDEEFQADVCGQFSFAIIFFRLFDSLNI